MFLKGSAHSHVSVPAADNPGSPRRDPVSGIDPAADPGQTVSPWSGPRPPFVADAPPRRQWGASLAGSFCSWRPFLMCV